ncbi:MAG: TIGR03986 family CRISPR-associated RAMP protein [Lachnospiraceae bacterium]|nr:TIGR03986 family CRISPR-associated RAMP protein [Lachnospiraceae bacterium]
MMGGGFKEKKFKDSYSNNKKNIKSNNGGNNNNSESSKYVGAPYNFISFTDKVFKYPKDKLVARNDSSDELFTGEISYTITAKGPIIVDDGNKQFCKNAYGKYAIPGSTMRGLIRNNVQILGLSSIFDDIGDYALMYRNVANGVERGRYNEILGAPNPNKNKKEINALKHVKAGYIKNEDGKYVIYKTDVDVINSEYGEMNYYVISERKIIDEFLHNKPFKYDFFVSKNHNILQHEAKEFKKGQDSKGKTVYKGVPNESYKPYYKEISYEISNLKNVTAVGVKGRYSKDGWVISSGKMNDKKAVYIIPKINKEKERIEIPDKDVAAFKTDIEKRSNTLKQFGGREFFDLPERGETKPVFYIELDRLYFGFTPRLRLFYDNTIKVGLNASHKPGIIDYSKAMFGYSNESGSYKSRISFSDAVEVNVNKYDKEESMILSEPKPTSYLDYLIQNDPNKAVTYNTDGFKLRGVKQYWLHNTIIPGEVTDKQENVATSFTPLDEGTVFKGKVRFQNLSEDELGLLLWSIKLSDDSWMNVGKAKPYGYGKISLAIDYAKSIDKKEAYNSEFNLDPFEYIDIDAKINAYKKSINKHLSGRKIEELDEIKQFFEMKNSKTIPDNEDIRYMTLDDFRARKSPVKDEHKKALPSIKKIISKKNNKE